MSKYIDGFVIPVHKDQLEAYKELSVLSGQVWKDSGAIDYVESIADDVSPGKVTSFPQSVDLKEGEVVVFSFITYRDRAHRDEVNAKAMEDPRMKNLKPQDFPFDGKRLIWGGFKTFNRM